MREFGKFLGWITVWGYMIALFNFVIKYINKNYIIKLSASKKRYKDI